MHSVVRVPAVAQSAFSRSPVTRLLALAATAVLIVAPTANAQRSGSTSPVEISLGGGLSMPQGDGLGDAGAGFALHGGIGLRPASLPVAFRVEAIFTRFTFDDGTFTTDDEVFEFSGTTAIYGATANLIVQREVGGLRPYGIAGGGIYRIDPSASVTGNQMAPTPSTDPGVNVGVGLSFAFQETQAFIEARYHSLFTDGEATNFIPIVLGVKF